MRRDQNGFIGRTDLGCDDLPPIEARRPDVSLLWPVAARLTRTRPVRLAFGLMVLNGLNAAQARFGTEHMLCVSVSVGETTGRRLNFDRRNAPTRLGLSF